ncbi:MAG TPA: HPF/RaiA family ribosome-associated protein [Ramlibacter sp.]
MQIQVNTGNGIDNKEALEHWAEGEVRLAMDRFGGDITRIEVHLAGGTPDKGGASDKRCTMEARLPRHSALAVTHHASGTDAAFRGALDKLRHLLDSKLGRAADHRRRDSIRNGEPGSEADEPAD